MPRLHPRPGALQPRATPERSRTSLGARFRRPSEKIEQSYSYGDALPFLATRGLSPTLERRHLAPASAIPEGDLMTIARSGCLVAEQHAPLQLRTSDVQSEPVLAMVTPRASVFSRLLLRQLLCASFSATPIAISREKVCTHQVAVNAAELVPTETARRKAHSAAEALLLGVPRHFQVFSSTFRDVIHRSLLPFFSFARLRIAA